MDWFSKHADTVIVLSAIIGSMLWMSGKFAGLEKDMAVVKTVLIMQKIMPPELAKLEEKHAE